VTVDWGFGDEEGGEEDEATTGEGEDKMNEGGWKSDSEEAPLEELITGDM
jgi:hypothetical protein